MKEIYTVADLKDWKKATRNVDPPIRLGVFGDPVAHSLSPQMQNAALKHCQIATAYARFRIEPNELRRALELIRELDFIGINLTVPHKINALAFVDEVETEAHSIGAVNTVVLKGGKLIGRNTDGKGIAGAIGHAGFGVSSLSDFIVLLLGAGGAGRAIARQCVDEGSPKLMLCNRSREAAEKLCAELLSLARKTTIVVIDQEREALRRALLETELLINATSIGLRPDDPLLIPRDLIPKNLFVYDTIYDPPRTKLLDEAEAAGAVGANGLGMLLHQGARSFELWFNQKAPIEEMRRALGL